ncbi:MAG: polysaccharide pyruvyl transferase family protein [Muribaculaceae bacterium]|nr:polysaccharide pyruvyl transferase family protein [Muribaculaceae bacterium]
MRIAILTQPLRANYGGVLQNYALQQILIKLGHEPITIEKDPYLHISKLKLFLELPKRNFTKYILKKRKYIFNEKQHNNYIRQLSHILKPFISKHINRRFVDNWSSIDYTLYDAFIVGSDQVWRPLYNWGILDKMFLSFIPESFKIKRIAYATSFGTTEWEYNDEQTSICSKLIQQFNAVSTREIDGVNLCNKYLGYNNAVSVLDPTLLLQKEDYLTLCKNISTCDENLLFAYILDTNSETISKLNYIAYVNGLTLKLVSAHNDCTLPMEQWLAMFRDAKIVITDSFHGTVFSIIFNKEFYTISNQSRGRSRFASLLSQLSLMDRMFESVSDIKIKENIYWSVISKKLSILKEQSLNFLKTSLS